MGEPAYMPLNHSDVLAYVSGCKATYRQHGTKWSRPQLGKVADYLQSWVGLLVSLVLPGSSPYLTGSCGAAFSSSVRTKTLTRIGATLTDLGSTHDVNSATWWTSLVVDDGIMSVNLSPACSDTLTHSKAMVIELSTLMARLVSIACTTTSTVTLIGKLAHRAGSKLRTALGKGRVSRAFQPAASVC